MASPLRFIPECRFDPKLVNGLDKAAQIMTQHLAQHFVNLRRPRLAPQALTELAFDQAECGFV